jgi:penicillin-binding protein 1C
LLSVFLIVYAFQVAERAHFVAPAPTPILYDRSGEFLAQFGDVRDGRVSYGYWAVPVLPERVVAATLAVEDRRFAAHPGVDVVAVARAAWSHVWGGRSGASTLAMQVARMQHPEARTLWAKLVEAGTAVALTARYGRSAVLRQYLRLVPYGNGSHGIGHAARWYFGKPVADLSWAEIALLAAVPQAPGAMNPYRPAGLRRARARGMRILGELGALGKIPPDQLAMARAELARLAVPPPPARPLAAMPAILAMGRMIAAHGGLDPADPRVWARLDLPMQRRVAGLAAAHLARWREAGAQQVAVMVVRRGSRAVLASVGSAGYASRPAGEMDFTRVLRSPGSTLKPFLYALALERGILSPAQVMDDAPGRAGGIQNADQAFLGPMLPAQALANSRNVPAAVLLRRIGLQAAFDRLRTLGLHHLDGSASRFGLSMAIGSLPTNLERLVTAYDALAEGGRARALLWYRGQARPAGRRVMPLAVAREVGLFLADPMARLPSFPRYGSSEFPFAVAVKTGTSQGYRDAWVLAWSQRYVIGVWVGRADAGPMRRLSGARAAGGLAQEILLDLHGVTRSDLSDDGFAPPAGLVAEPLCATTGRVAGADCPSRLLEYVRPDAVRTAAAAAAPGLSILSPSGETRIWRNPEVPPGLDRLALRAEAAPGVRQILWLVDGRPFAVADPRAVLYWPTVAGVHRFQIRLPLQADFSRTVRVVVE